jgi:plastocyanin
MRLLPLVLAAAALAVAGCGGSSNNSSGSSNSTPTSTPAGSSGPLTVTADPGGAISWDKHSLSAKAGKVSITLVNKSTTPHALEVEGNGVEQKTMTFSGSSAKLSLELKPGKYKYYCPVPGHKATMNGTLTVS